MPLNVSVPVSVNNFGGIATSVTGNVNENIVVTANVNNGINCGIPAPTTITGNGWGESIQSNNLNVDIGTSRWGANESVSNGNNGGGLMWPSQQSGKNDDAMTADAMVIL